ncbi:MAG: HDOD domain-containing protein [Denitratisoma sp.]|nr:HDOD domain-containing protein [Denitratisoma sp.]
MSPVLSRETVLSRIADLPALPAVVGDILGAIEDETETVERLVGRVNADPVLVARILGAANAAAQGGRQRIGSLMDAITLLGFNRVRQLVLMTALVRQFQPLAPGFDPTAFWRHSFAVAACAGALARETAFDEELAFNAGLLHDIGQLLIVVAFPREFEEILARMAALDTDTDTVEAEREVLGLDHGQVGSILAGYWRLPEAFVEAIDGHHQPDVTNYEAYSNIVHVAEVLSYALDIGTVPRSVVPALSDFARAHLGVSWPAVAGRFGEIEARYRAACLDFGF